MSEPKPTTVRVSSFRIPCVDLDGVAHMDPLESATETVEAPARLGESIVPSGIRVPPISSKHSERFAAGHRARHAASGCSVAVDDPTATWRPRHVGPTDGIIRMPQSDTEAAILPNRRMVVVELAVQTAVAAQPLFIFQYLISKRHVDLPTSSLSRKRSAKNGDEVRPDDNAALIDQRGRGRGRRATEKSSTTIHPGCRSSGWGNDLGLG